MKITDKLLTINPYSRPGKLPINVKAVILHWVGVPGQKAISVWNWFEKNCPANRHYSSAHYIIDLDGSILRAIPDSEVAWHCGSAQKDPASGRIYTDWAKEKFGRYAANPETISPNYCTVGIEMCVTDEAGNYTTQTFESAAELTASLLRKHHLTPDDMGTHNMVVGWKDCPRLWTNNPSMFNGFKEQVKKILEAA